MEVATDEDPSHSNFYDEEADALHRAVVDIGHISAPVVATSQALPPNHQGRVKKKTIGNKSGGQTEDDASTQETTTEQDGDKSHKLQKLKRLTIVLSVLVVVLMGVSVVSLVLLLKGDECERDKDCGEEGFCGLTEARKKANKVCCSRTFGNENMYPKTLASMAVLDDGTSAPVCKNRPAGTFCNDSDEICASGACGGSKKCLVDDLEAGQECSEATQCRSSYGCGYTEAKQEGKKVCCASGQNIVRGFSVCKGVPEGSFCNDVDELCETDTCGVDGLCISSKLSDGEVCQRGRQCDNGQCALRDIESPETVCCGKTFMDANYKQICAGVLSDGEQCVNNQACNSGICSTEGKCTSQRLNVNQTCQNSVQCASGACALAEPIVGADKVCCNLNFVRAVTVENVVGSNRLDACGNLPTGFSCHGHHKLCATGNCGGNNTCAEEVQVGDSCERDSQCATGSCGLIGDFVEAPRLCCESSSTQTHVYDGVDDYGRKYDHVCTSLPAGTPCVNDIICASGACVNNTCAQTKLPMNAICERTAQCQENACGFIEADTTSAKVCCPSGATVSGNGLGGYATVCTRMPLGTFCHKIPEMCLSGMCVRGTCSDALLDDNQECSASNECQTEACGLPSANATDNSYTCCSSGSVFLGVVEDAARPGARATHAVCTLLPAGTYCKDLDSICASRICERGFCL